MKLLTISTLYPNNEQPSHGVFVENRLRHMLTSGEVEARVVAPVPWFPSTHPRFGTYAAHARVMAAETRHGVRITHPRYALLPKVGMHSAPLFMYWSLAKHVRKLMREGLEFDLIDGHYFYPDGVAIAMLARALGKPFVVTARGTDISLIPRYTLPRRMIRWTANSASACITVCQALNDSLVELGVSADHVHTLRNGVDLSQFQPVDDRDGARQELGVAGKVLLTVGHLIERKGNHLVLEAMPELPDMTLLLAGDGPERSRLEAQARALGVADRTQFLGRVAHDELRRLYAAADALILASSREGWANVLLEAMACGTPVAATSIWGTPEVVAEAAAGRLIPERSGDSIAQTVRELLADPPERAQTRAYAERFSWDDTTAGQLDLFRAILAGERTART
ncbi:MAG: glycosyltransferase family 4 protein [Pseudomonadota bacterium]